MLVVAYGSLISKKSRLSTVNGCDVGTGWVHGYRRRLNLFSLKKEIVVMNAEPSENSSFNCVVFEIEEEELAKLKEREATYDTKTVDVDVCGRVVQAVMFVGKEGRACNAPPDVDYLEFCREAAYAVSEEFGKEWDCTTYLADGTLVKDFHSQK